MYFFDGQGYIFLDKQNLSYLIYVFQNSNMLKGLFTLL